MSEDMSSWRSLASAASRSVKNYVSQKRANLPTAAGSSRDLRGADDRGEAAAAKLSWTQWAGQKLRRNGQIDDGTNDRVALFPGWATRRYHHPMQDGINSQDAPFDVEIFVSGFASRYSGPGFNTRAGRAFLRLARGFASLPKLPAGLGQLAADDSRTQLTPLPDEIEEEEEIAALESQFRELEAKDRNTNVLSQSIQNPPLDFRAPPVDSSSSSTTSSSSASSSSSSSSSNSSSSHEPPPAALTDLQRWHANLEARLQPFWSNAISSRTVRLSLYACYPGTNDSDNASAESGSTKFSYEDNPYAPIVTQNVLTTTDGAFQLQIVVPWETLCMHPGALQIAFGDRQDEVEMFVHAELMPPPILPTSGTSSPANGPPQNYFPVPTATCTIPVTLSHSKVRLISDIDDTVKLSHIISGARAVFHNVFVKELKENIIDGMGDWYTAMWEKGVRFHYVSNSPYELLPVINEFFQLSHLPPGSIKLRSYAGRTLFSGLLSAPAARKRAGVIHVLDSFPQSRFFLVGDTAEQDLELYASIARERPEQILAVFVRDASTQLVGGALGRGHGRGVKPLDDPTGAKVFEQGGIPQAPGRASPLPQTPRRTSASSSQPRDVPSRSMSDGPGLGAPSYARYVPRRAKRTFSEAPTPSPAPLSCSPPSAQYFPARATTMSPPLMEEPLSEQLSARDVERDAPRNGPPSKAQQQLFELEKRRAELQLRVYRARLEIPQHIKLRVFITPQECVEAMDILDTLQLKS